MLDCTSERQRRKNKEVKEESRLCAIFHLMDQTKSSGVCIQSTPVHDSNEIADN